MSFHDIKKINKAKKRHLCLICGGAIFEGDSYYRVAGKQDGDFYSYETCERCDELINSELREHIADDDGCVGEYPLFECLIMGYAISCPRCESYDIYECEAIDERKIKAKVKCEQCEEESVLEITLKGLCNGGSCI